MRKYTALDIPSVEWINSKKNHKPYKALSFFSGCGSASLGAKLAGFDVLFANEFIPIAAESYKLNAAPHTIVDTSDIRKLNPDKIMKRLKLKKGEIDFIEASPPCKLMSTAGKATRDRNKKHFDPVKYSENVWQRVDDLFDQAVRMIKGFMPKTFLLENVAGMASGDRRSYFLETINDLKRCGYRVKAAKIDASFLGVPQRRVRLIFLGVRNDLKGDPVFPLPLKKTVSVRDVLPHVTHISEGEGKFGDSRRPGPTITAYSYNLSPDSFFSSSGRIKTEDGEIRRLSIPELKRLFGLPEDFRLAGLFRQRWERLGRSHASLSVYYCAASLRENVLDKQRKR